MDLVEQPAPGARFARHPWEVARYRFFADVLLRAGLGAAPVELLDAGAGDGWFTRTLVAATPAITRAVLWDSGYEQEHLERTGGRIEHVRDRPAGSFGFVLLLDVLEHVENDAGFLAETVAANLAPGGSVVVSVPAWPALTSAHDQKLGHHRRYRPEAARALLGRAGLVALRSGGLFHSLLGARAAAVLRERIRPPDDSPPTLEWHGGAMLTSAVGWALRLDRALSTWAADLGMELPGLSWWALCKRSS